MVTSKMASMKLLIVRFILIINMLKWLMVAGECKMTRWGDPL